MEAVVNYINGAKFEVVARGHRVVCDQPQSNGGTDEGMTPPEFLLASLGTCAGFYAAQYLKARSLSTEGLSVKVVGEKAAQPARVGSFEIVVDAPGAGSDERHREGLTRAVKSCLVHNTLLHSPSIALKIRTGAAVEV